MPSKAQMDVEVGQRKLRVSLEEELLRIYRWNDPLWELVANTGNTKDFRALARTLNLIADFREEGLKRA